MKPFRFFKSKTVALSLSVVLALSLLSACSSGGNNAPSASPKASPGTSSSPSATTSADDLVYPENGLPKNENVTLKFGFFEGGMGREYIDYAMDTFKKKFPNVNFEVTYSPKIGEIINAKISAGNDDDMFDLFNGFIPGGIIPLVESGKLLPQDDLWDRELYDNSGKTLKELALDGTIEAAVGRVSNQLYALPIAGSGSGLFFNKKLFEKNDWNQNPKTWSEFEQLLESIKSKGVIPITYPGKYTDYMDLSFGPIKMFELADLNGNLQTFEDNFRNYKLPQYLAPESVEMWKRIYELGKKGYFPEGVAALSHTQSQMQMIQGQAAMVSTGVYVENEMKDSIPDDFVWGFMSVPMSENPDSTRWIRSTAASGHYIWANKPELNKKWAKEFNIWMWNLDVQEVIAEKGGQLPLRKDFSDDSARAAKLQQAPKAMFDFMSTNKTKMAADSRNATLTDPSAAQAQKLMLDATTEITSGKKDPQPLLEEAEKLIQKAIEAQK
ncbi:extracellular solute-binding protein [Paenibacillus eucommiae]|uniref:N-acetylglucosamine transport system substrate-binding protein n=1 Tax=Paenibacillus eucommiae TaxID=1355755 RepID=A0ABS4JA31_9BACL|nr:extracellular solute-binding protein [Paenibacillus eucommiae]MBP1996121.1 N-acetylglucosamine transport system substrate-binding protein [Paenibacillus eucommiae]